MRFRLEVSLNGEHLGTAGFSSYGMLVASVMLIERDAGMLERITKRHGSSHHADEAEANLNFWGSDWADPKDIGSGSGIRYWAQRELKAGDVIVIRVLDSGPFDQGEP